MAIDPEVARLELEQEFETQRINTVQQQKQNQIAEAINAVDFNVRPLQVEPDSVGFNVRQLQIEPDNRVNDDQTETVVISNGNVNNSNNSNDILDNQNPRLKNVLSRFSSVTYQLTLYMITADAYNAFLESGRKNINVFKDWKNSGTYIVAQSGGVDTANDDRPPGLKLDYYIDNLRIVNQVNAKATATASNLTQISFDIHEPYGFSFINKLAEANATLKSKTRLPAATSQHHSSRQFFILGIRYIGYDAAGNIVTKESDLGLNPALENEDNNLFESFYEIFILNMKFRIGAGTTIYSITASPISTIVPYGFKYGRIDNGAEIIADSVGEALSGSQTSLLDRLNYEQIKLRDKEYIEIPNQYYVEFVGPGSESIKNAKLRTKEDHLKNDWPMEIVDKLSNVNEYIAIKSTPDATKSILTLTKGISIMQSIENIIKKSTFLSQALRTIYYSELEATTNDRTVDQINSNPRYISWYNLSSKVEVLGWDNKKNDWSYKITYYIQRYETPFVISPYVKKFTNNYRPHKRYEYYFTGKNTEILSYDQSIDNQWLNAEVGIKKEGNNDDGTSTPNIPNKLTGGDRTGKVDISLEAQNNFVNNLYDPKSWATAKLQILGDPDFLIKENVASINNVYRQYYGDDFTVNANSGQVFIEIDFKEGVDYDHSKGLLNVNDQLTFWRYPEEVKKHIKGVSYLVTAVQSEFNGGKYTQTLSLTINTNVNVKSTKSDIYDQYPATGREGVPKTFDANDYYKQYASISDDDSRTGKIEDDQYTARVEQETRNAIEDVTRFYT